MRLRGLHLARTLFSLACGILTIFVSLYKIIFFIFYQICHFCKIFVKTPLAKSVKRTFFYILFFYKNINDFYAHIYAHTGTYTSIFIK